MRICPACGNQFPDDANFCPMDASRLSEPLPVTAPVGTEGHAANTPSSDLMGSPTQPSARAPSTLVDQPGPIAGRFALTDTPVATPTGEVWRALDLQTKLPVQVLVVAPEALPTPTLADRALREIKQLAKVKSDKVLRIIDQGKTDEGRVYVASELPEGPTLDELLQREGALPLERARAILLAVGEALAEAQKVGVIHRDLGPRNIVAGAHVKVTGFGVAEPVDDKVFGAPAFLSPEQAEGKPVDQRSNIYSLGALFYYMVTGSPPFDGGGSGPTTPMAIIQQHLHAQPVPPSQRRPGISTEVDRVVLKALEKSGGRRHLTLRQLLTEVEGLQAPGARVVEPSLTPPARAVDTTPLPAPIPARSPETAASSARTMMHFGTPSTSAPSVSASAGPESRSAQSPGDRIAASSAKADRPPSDPVVMPVSLSRSHEDVLPGARASDRQDSASAAAGATSPVAGTMVGTQLPPEAIESAARRMGLQPVPDAPYPDSAASVPTPLTQQKTLIEPKPATLAQAQQPMSAAARPGPTSGSGSGPAPAKAKKGFRETAWFKRGELEEELARKAAELSQNDPLAGPSQTEAVVDESTLTTDDRQRLSLKTGRTEMMPALKAQSIPGERMSEEDMIAEMDSSRKLMIFAGAGIGALAVVLTIYFVFLRH